MSVELLSPAGNFEKLAVAFQYGADAAYMGLSDFSLRANAHNFGEDDLAKVIALKKRTGKKLYCAMNILFHEDQIENLKQQLPEIKKWPFDAFIISDIGLVPLIKEVFGTSVELHLSTQASCMNSSSASMYYQMGFSRVILGRETSLDEIKKIKVAVPQLQLEVFVHGAMCMAYSGRCLLSSFLTGRSGNQGDCSHTCRWDYQLLQSENLVLEEKQRPGTYYPISEQDGHTTILSSKDLCMIDHIQDLLDAGVDALKIEGRMKSSYYVAVVTRAYRKALDGDSNWKAYREDLMNISHREYSTGFFYGHGPVDPAMGESIDTSTQSGYLRDYLFCGFIKDEVKEHVWSLDLKNQIKLGQTLEYLGSEVLKLEDDEFVLLDAEFQEVFQVDHGKVQYLKTEKPIKQGYIIRRENKA
ncbi:U32 family peptidase [uncultured Sphaerochaeta sp.]|uniref:U32 family peptidase n=1 Tax=uncultured Sphaerochaeta sp. TaxID=886478 RepID=UPI002A0A9305|nr:U32 family peptidase [uncultured Sphaerochaeta sp.]